MDEFTKINQCIVLLKGSNLSTIKKLRVEIQLIQMKRHLLNDEYPVTGSCGRVAVDGVLDTMGNICGGRYEGTLTDQIERLSWMLTVLGSQHANNSIGGEAFPSYLSGTA